MCDACGCHDPDVKATIRAGVREVHIGASLLEANDKEAQHNRQRFIQAGIATVGLLSSPGSGKTTLLARTIAELHEDHRIGVLVGDLETEIDANRLRKAGIHDQMVAQIITGGTCHLDAKMVAAGLDQLAEEPELLFIENVGNLVCPGSFGLGEDRRVVLLSTTEGIDKPLKYPQIFAQADLVLITKLDLLPHLDFDLDHAISHIHRVAPDVEIVSVSAKDGTGMGQWLDWIRAGVLDRAR